MVVSGGGDFLELAFVGWPPHPFRFGDEVADASLRPELTPQLESPPRGPIMGLFALGCVSELVSLARGEGERAIRQIEFRSSPPCPRAEKPPPPASKGLRRGLKLDRVIGLMALSIL
jgi:hypothetical protein